MSGLTWGYHGTGPYTFFTLMQLIAPDIEYEDIVALEWMAKDPIVLEKVNGRFMLTDFDESVKNMIRIDKFLPWDFRRVKVWSGKPSINLFEQYLNDIKQNK